MKSFTSSLVEEYTRQGRLAEEEEDIRGASGVLFGGGSNHLRSLI